MTYNFSREESLTIFHLAREELKNFSKLVAGLDQGILSQSDLEKYNEYMCDLEGILHELGCDIRREDFIESEPELSSKKKRDHEGPYI